MAGYMLLYYYIINQFLSQILTTLKIGGLHKSNLANLENMGLMIVSK